MYCSSIALRKEIARGIEQGNYTRLRKDCTLEEIAQAIANRDRLAGDCYQRVCERLAIGVVNAINLLNPDTIVIDDDIASVAPDVLKECLNKIVSQSVLPQLWNNLEIRVGEGTQAFVLKGVAILAAENLLRKVFAKQ